MKKKILCLLLALVVVISVVPLTAFAATVPEEYQGDYEVVADVNGEDALILFTIYKDKVSISIADACYGEDLPLTGFDDTQAQFERNNGYCAGKFSIDFGKLSAKLYTDALWKSSVYMYNIKKVSDSTNSTLSTGSDLIIPLGAAVLLMGAVIFIGKRKKEKTE